MDTTIIRIVREGGVGVLPTDTIYGLVASALNRKAVEKVYKLKKRTPDKPSIILISSLENLRSFKISLDNRPQTINYLQKLWPNPVSVILSCAYPEFEYLHRGANSLAFRMPNHPELLELLKETGPLIAPSANLEGQTPAETIEQAREYFGNQVDFYIDGGKLTREPSTLISIADGQVKVLRRGAFSAEKIKI